MHVSVWKNLVLIVEQHLPGAGEAEVVEADDPTSATEEIFALMVVDVDNTVTVVVATTSMDTVTEEISVDERITETTDSSTEMSITPKKLNNTTQMNQIQTMSMNSHTHWMLKMNMVVRIIIQDNMK